MNKTFDSQVHCSWWFITNLSRMPGKKLYRAYILLYVIISDFKYNFYVYVYGNTCINIIFFIWLLISNFIAVSFYTDKSFKYFKFWHKILTFLLYRLIICDFNFISSDNWTDNVSKIHLFSFISHLVMELWSGKLNIRFNILWCLINLFMPYKGIVCLVTLKIGKTII